MNLALWVLQGLLALHTLMGSVWKFSNSEQSVPSLRAFPHGAWIALSILEIICAVCLVVPAVRKSLAVLAPIAVLCIAAEMLLFVGLHLASSASDKQSGQMIYWLVVVAFCAFIAYGRLVLKPL